MDIVVSTNNFHKLIEFNRILKLDKIKLLSLKDENYNDYIDESGITFKENSRIKAEEVYLKLKKPTIADDSGLEINFLNNEPGIYSARYGGEDLTDKERCFIILDRMKGVPKQDRLARFICCISYINKKGVLFQVEETCEGYISERYIGDNGFGYDPIFLVDDVCFGLISGSEKDIISHRGKAIRKIRKYILEKVVEKNE